MRKAVHYDFGNLKRRFLQPRCSGELFSRARFSEYRLVKDRKPSDKRKYRSQWRNYLMPATYVTEHRKGIKEIDEAVKTASKEGQTSIREWGPVYLTCSYSQVSVRNPDLI